MLPEPVCHRHWAQGLGAEAPGSGSVLHSNFSISWTPAHNPWSQCCAWRSRKPGAPLISNKKRSHNHPIESTGSNLPFQNLSANMVRELSLSPNSLCWMSKALYHSALSSHIWKTKRSGWLISKVYPSSLIYDPINPFCSYYKFRQNRQKNVPGGRLRAHLYFFSLR